MERLRDQQGRIDPSDPVAERAASLVRAGAPLDRSAAREARIEEAVRRRVARHPLVAWLRPMAISGAALGAAFAAGAWWGSRLAAPTPVAPTATPATTSTPAIAPAPAMPAAPAVAIPPSSMPAAPAVAIPPSMPSPTEPSAPSAPISPVAAGGPPRPDGAAVANRARARKEPAAGVATATPARAESPAAATAPAGDPASAYPPPAPAPEPAAVDLGHELVLAAARALRNEHDNARASALLAEYLRLHPDGALVEEALALAIEAAAQRGDASAAGLAERYLQRFPAGRYRDAALRARRRFSP